MRGSSRSTMTTTHEHDRSWGGEGNRGDPFYFRCLSRGSWTLTAQAGLWSW